MAEKYAMRILKSIMAAPLLGVMLAAVSALPADARMARFADEGVKQVGKGEAARYSIDAPAGATSDFKGHCELTAEGGSVNVAVDGMHYIPLSPPAVGDVLTLQPGETRSYEMTGTFEPNSTGTAQIGFIFSGSPAGFCFPGQQCNDAKSGAARLKVSCVNSQ